jgi:hypothetical protein
MLAYVNYAELLFCCHSRRNGRASMAAAEPTSAVGGYRGVSLAERSS